MATPSDTFRLLNNSIPPNPANGFGTTCCTKTLFSDPNNARFKTCGNQANYPFRYECDMRPDNSYRFMIQGSRNPVDCHLSHPFINADNLQNDTIDNLSTCGALKYLGYNRNGRYVGSIYGDVPAQFLRND
jgi:hypothetical protein